MQRYREALYNGFQALKARPLTTNLFIEIVWLIKQTELGIRAIPGTALKNDAGQVVYTPPVGEAVIRDKLGNLEQFIHAEDGIDPLVKMAVVHYQFEAIHPFPDGNGRTGRIINLLYLVEKGLLDIPVLFMSRYIIANRAGPTTKVCAASPSRRIGRSGFCSCCAPSNRRRSRPTTRCSGFAP